MMKRWRFLNFSFNLILIFSLTACGFHLRGSNSLPFKSAVIQEQRAGTLAALVKQQLNEQGINTNPAKPEDANIVIHLMNENIERRVLVISALTGKQEEVEINYRAEVEVKKVNGEILLAKQTLSLVRDLNIDPSIVLAKDAEEQVLREELVREIAAQVMRRLEKLPIEVK